MSIDIQLLRSVLAAGEGLQQTRPLLYERAQHFHIPDVVGVWLRGCFQNEGCVPQLRMAGNAPQSIGSNMSLADVPVAVDTRIVSRSRVVEVDSADAAGADSSLYDLHRRFESFFFADIVSGRKSVRRI